MSNLSVFRDYVALNFNSKSQRGFKDALKGFKNKQKNVGSNVF